MTVKQRMMDALPRYYSESPEADAIVSGQAYAVDFRKAEARDLLEQMSPITATWGIAHWERALGLATVPTKPLEERRSLVIARLRGAQVATVANVKATAEAFYGGEIDVIEDFANYMAHFKFKSNLGVPPNEDDVRNALRDILPAHIAFDFLYTFLLIREIHGVKTLSEMEQIPLSQFAGA